MNYKKSSKVNTIQVSFPVLFPLPVGFNPNQWFHSYMIMWKEPFRPKRKLRCLLFLEQASSTCSHQDGQKHQTNLVPLHVTLSPEGALFFWSLQHTFRQGASHSKMFDELLFFLMQHYKLQDFHKVWKLFTVFKQIGKKVETSHTSYMKRTPQAASSTLTLRTIPSSRARRRNTHRPSPG